MILNKTIRNRGKDTRDQIIQGIILLDKPYGITSNQALQKVKRILNVKKAGHTGSLDPMATGMLPIFINQATKFSQFMLDADKTYLATIQLGQVTDTGDKEGKTIKEMNVPYLDEALIEDFLEQFRGEIKQIPPMYSALKRDGRVLYKLAREGITVERDPRVVTVYKLINMGFISDKNQLNILTTVSKGTYIRTLAEDIGNRIGCGAHLISLRRISCGGFSEDDEMITIDKLLDHAASPDCKMSSILKKMDVIFDNWPVYHLNSMQTSELYRSGRWLGEDDHLNGWHVLRLDDKFIGIGEFYNGQLKSRKLLID